jgi:FkbM family methyltransferase
MRYPAWMPVTNEASHTFVPSIMPARPIVLDLGANEGSFHDAILRRFLAPRYVAVEPTARLAATLSGQGISVVEAAVAKSTGPVQFSIDTNSEASTILTAMPSEMIDGLSYTDLIKREHLDRIDLVKMDIEGAELFALGDTERELLRIAAQITVEFHDFCGILTTTEVNGLIARMRQFEFNGVRFSTNNTDWLFVRNDAISRTRWWRVLVIAWLRRNVHRVRLLRSGSVARAPVAPSV